MIFFHFNTPQINLISNWALNWSYGLFGSLEREESRGSKGEESIREGSRGE